MVDEDAALRVANRQPPRVDRADRAGRTPRKARANGGLDLLAYETPLSEKMIADDVDKQDTNPPSMLALHRAAKACPAARRWTFHLRAWEEGQSADVARRFQTMNAQLKAAARKPLVCA